MTRLAFEFIIRDATIEDAEAICHLVGALARETIGERQEVMSVEAARRWGFGADRAFECIVAAHGGEIVATVLYYDEFSSWRGKKGVYILDIYIAPPARGQGLGRRLIAETARRAAARGAGYVRLAVDQANIHAVNFYEAIGFEEGSQDRVFILSGEALEAIGRA